MTGLIVLGILAFVVFSVAARSIGIHPPEPRGDSAAPRALPQDRAERAHVLGAGGGQDAAEDRPQRAGKIANVIGSLTLDKTLTSRNEINGKLRTILDEVTDKWGIKVTRVELKEITPPRDTSRRWRDRFPDGFSACEVRKPR